LMIFLNASGFVQAGSSSSETKVRSVNARVSGFVPVVSLANAAGGETPVLWGMVSMSGTGAEPV